MKKLKMLLIIAGMCLCVLINTSPTVRGFDSHKELPWIQEAETNGRIEKGQTNFSYSFLKKTLKKVDLVLPQGVAYSEVTSKDESNLSYQFDAESRKLTLTSVSGEPITKISLPLTVSNQGGARLILQEASLYSESELEMTMGFEEASAATDAGVRADTTVVTPTPGMIDVLPTFESERTGLNGDYTEQPITKVEANNTLSGKISTKTTMLYVTYNGTVQAPKGLQLYESAVTIFDSRDKNIFSVPNNFPEKPTTAEFKNKVFQIPVRFGNKGGQTFYLGSSDIFFEPKGPGTAARPSEQYKFEIVRNELHPTIENRLTTDSSFVEGTGHEDGNSIKITNLTRNISTETSVRSDLSYEAVFMQAFREGDVIQVEESNDYGDYGKTSKIVEPGLKLVLTIANPTIIINPTIVKSYVKMTDEEIMADLVKRFEMTSVDANYHNNPVEVQYEPSAYWFLGAIRDGVHGDSYSSKLTISRNNKFLMETEDELTVKVEGKLEFKTLTPEIHFSKQMIGTEQDVAASNKITIGISDTRLAGSDWKVMVSASDFISAEGKKLAGSLQINENNKKTSLNSGSQVFASGKKIEDVDNFDLAKNWNNQKEGLFLNIKGGNYAGSYSAEVEWTLSEAP